MVDRLDHWRDQDRAPCDRCGTPVRIRHRRLNICVLCSLELLRESGPMAVLRETARQEEVFATTPRGGDAT